jgi:hypothetical protein
VHRHPNLLTRSRRLLPLALLTLLLTWPGAASAQVLSNYSVSLLGGIGGAFDVEPDPGLTNTSVQLGFSLALDRSSLFTARLGQLDLGDPEGFGGLAGADLTYITLGGEYRLQRPLYDSGLYLGLGGYRLEGTRFATGESDEDTALGIVFGVTADFPITRHFSILSELSGHYADLEEAQFFGILHVGVAFHF